MTAPAEPSIAHSIEHQCWRPDFSRADFERICAAARQHQIRAIVVNGCRVELACELLEDSGVKVVAAVGFPLGAMDGDAKRYEVEVAIDQGAQAIEAVLNLGLVRDGNFQALGREFRDLVDAADERPVRIALDPTLLRPGELEPLVKLIASCECSGVVLSTALGSTVPAAADIQAVAGWLTKPQIVKASGAIRDREDALALLASGASLLGVADPSPLLA